MDRHNFYYRFKVDTQWLEDFVEDIEVTDRSLLLALTSSTGISSGFGVVERGAGQNFSVDVVTGVAFDPSGRRVYNDGTTNVPFTTDISSNPIQVVGGGNERIVSVYASYLLVDDLTSSVVDGWGDTVYKITNEQVVFTLVQGTEAAAGLAVPAAHPGGNYIRLANVTIAFGDSTIVNANIDTSIAELLNSLIQTDAIDDTMIDWGTGANQVAANDIPIVDSGSLFPTDNVESALSFLANRLIPIGTIIGHYDYDGTIAVNTDYFVYCDGSVVSNVNSPLNTLATPDMSNRYLVGFGTEVGGNVDTDAWVGATDAQQVVGQASHQINIQHSHTVDSHTHTIDSHTHTVPDHSHTVASHAHDAGDYQFRTAGMVSSGTTHTLYFYTSIGGQQTVFNQNDSSPQFQSGSDQIGNAISGATTAFYTASGTGNSGSASPATNSVTGISTGGTSSSTGGATPGTGSQLSTTQTIQPRSIRVRWIMRVA